MTDKEIIIINEDEFINKTLDFVTSEIQGDIGFIINKLKERLQRKTAECKRYEQALNEIEKEIYGFGSLITIQDIITKAKDGNNDR